MLSLIKDQKMYMKLKSVELKSSEKSNVRLLVAAYKRHLYPQSETVSLRNSLVLMKQNSGESIEDFAIRIENLVEKVYPENDYGSQAALTTLLLY